ncbi:hypothetical protein SERLADRAFT_431652 [Serpula lacrymans var. lacrymans S7.9]|uniref:EthD domain-containing protein n=1 Tax=Serpula lacrymans var. lacrymans (strain S7.9) TaxID=578457 RepID=F8ND96_SERL9|nr:uncharacterized protein SERLADRAFT_431652 [Serpula lacrymans var. lacrymans S7.9]XP_007317897.1 uncharacterized protein SERLADRAFT_369151 [Serpula lacrymans var. lacrymans S7.9]XP_007321718.1 uncharacterized protein SERLADRAFT_372570 [Serpula lacrymans var. lacrymans S7.9]EGO21932.1 hypothetical protein SERLADRAFT_372570 [Serpula lacrymans var. lacrymans S7.9]EGO25775.1 hypothetical protein SERLADRAFT_369151 [Serpula lacrymans var. lacrymans S7.9]EGO30180.1 hypothetical protein SERLADRAFT_4
MALRIDHVRIVALFKTKEGISKEDFDKFWLDDHSKLFDSLHVVKFNLVVSDAISAAAWPCSTLQPFRPSPRSSLMRSTTVELKHFEKGGQMLASNFATIIDN